MEPQSFFDAVKQVFQFVAGSSTAVTLSVVGFVLLFLAGILTYKALKSKPEEFPRWLKVAFYVCLVGGLIFSAAGPSWVLFHVSQNTIRTETFDETFDKLITNKRVRYVVRLISYNRVSSPDLKIDLLQRLGPPKQLYSFVADYEELRGRTVKEALDMIGVGYNGHNYVTAVIFPLQTEIYPANARGLLQVISTVERRTDPKDRFLGPDKFNPEELEDLHDTSRLSYRVTAFRSLYPHYCKVAREFFCSKHTTREFVGGLFDDWHPLGFSQKEPPRRPCQIAPETFCAFSDWDRVKPELSKNFGSRAFLIENLDVKSIPRRLMIDFEDRVGDKIPDIGLPLLPNEAVAQQSRD